MPNLVPRENRHPMARLRNSMAEWFDSVLPERFFGDGEEETSFPAVLRMGTPAIDVVDDGEEVRVTAELPGLEKDDFQVEVVGDRLIIRGEKMHCREEKEGDYHFAERSYGSFSRVVDLPAEVDLDRAEAVYKNGELKLRLPKTEAAKSRRVKVAVE